LVPSKETLQIALSRGRRLLQEKAAPPKATACGLWFAHQESMAESMNIAEGGF